MDKETLPCYIFVISLFVSLLPCVIFNRYYHDKRKDHYYQLLRLWMHPLQIKWSMLVSFRFKQFLMCPGHGNRYFSSSTYSDIVLLFDFVCGLFLCNPVIFKYITSGKYNQKWIKQKTTDVIRVFLTWSWTQSTYLFFQLWARESDRGRNSPPTSSPALTVQ